MKEFIDAPVKTYSSGMYMRLGFAVAIHVDPDVLLVDEVLAVGDEGFTHKCLDKFAEFKRRGKTILLVTHSLGLVERFCDEALWLDAGRLKGSAIPSASSAPTSPTSRQRGDSSSPPATRRAQEAARRPWSRPTSPSSAVLPDNPVETATGPADMFRATEGRWGSREVEITDVRLEGADGAPGHRLPRPASGSTCASACARRCRSTTSSSASASSTPKASAATAPTPRSRSWRRSAWRATPRRFLDRVARSRRGHLQAGRRRPQARRLSVRLPPPALHLPREVAREGRRHLPAEARLAVRRRRHVQDGRRRRVVNLLDAAGARALRPTTREPPARADRVHQRCLRPAASRATCAISRRPARTAIC